MIIRKAETRDLDDVFKWRKDPVSVKMSFDSAAISISEHREWFLKALKSSTRQMYMGVFEDRAIGVCRFDLNRKENLSQVSISLDPKERGKGFGVMLLEGAIGIYAVSNQVDFLAKIKTQNRASIKLFEKSRFCQVSASECEIIMKRSSIC